MNEIKVCPGDLSTRLSTNFSVFRFILNLEKDIIKQNTYYISSVYLFIFHDPVVLTHHLIDSDIYSLSSICSYIYDSSEIRVCVQVEFLTCSIAWGLTNHIASLAAIWRCTSPPPHIIPLYRWRDPISKRLSSDSKEVASMLIINMNPNLMWCIRYRSEWEILSKQSICFSLLESSMFRGDSGEVTPV